MIDRSYRTLESALQSWADGGGGGVSVFGVVVLVPEGTLFLVFSI